MHAGATGTYPLLPPVKSCHPLNPPSLCTHYTTQPQTYWGWCSQGLMAVWLQNCSCFASAAWTGLVAVPILHHCKAPLWSQLGTGLGPREWSPYAMSDHRASICPMFVVWRPSNKPLLMVMRLHHNQCSWCLAVYLCTSQPTWNSVTWKFGYDIITSSLKIWRQHCDKS